MSEPSTSFWDMTPDTYALVAQIVPVFLLIFAVRGSYLTRASVADVRRRPRRSLNRRWYQDPRTQWALIIILFLIFEFLLVLGAAEFWMMPASWVWIGLFLTLAYAAMEFWLAGTIAGTTGQDD